MTIFDYRDCCVTLRSLVLLCGTVYQGTSALCPFVREATFFHNLAHISGEGDRMYHRRVLGQSITAQFNTAKLMQ